MNETTVGVIISDECLPPLLAGPSLAGSGILYCALCSLSCGCAWAYKRASLRGPYASRGVQTGRSCPDTYRQSLCSYLFAYARCRCVPDSPPRAAALMAHASAVCVPRASFAKPNQWSWGEIQNYYIQLRPDVRLNSNFFPEKKPGRYTQGSQAFNAVQSSESFQRESGKALL